jgi:hypothetical protein
MNIKFFYLIAFLVINLNALSFNLVQIATLSITNDIKIPSDPYYVGSMMIRSRKDGVFIFQRPGGDDHAVIVLTNGNFLVRKPQSFSNSIKTNIIQSFIENNELNIIQREVTTSVFIQTRPDLVLKTISNDFFIDFTDIRTNVSTSDFKINSRSKIEITNYTSSYRTGYFSKISLKGQPGKHIAFRSADPFSIEGHSSRLYDYRETDIESKTIISCVQRNDLLVFYRITDSDLLQSPNRITLGSSQNGSLTATVNNPEQALLNIQSSTNLIDWNTFKTIQNEPSLEIVVPANQPKEFIRAIE